MSLSDIYARYNLQVQFLPIYIAEAHPVDGWWLGRGLLKWIMKLYSPKASTGIYTHQTLEERRKAAGECEQSLKYGIRTYVDEMDDAVSKAYAAYPTRLYLIGMNGDVVYASGLGPFDFHPWKIGRAIEQYLHDQVA